MSYLAYQTVFYDAYRHAPFNVKTHILLNVFGCPGVAKVFKTMGSGAYQGCMWCTINGKH